MKLNAKKKKILITVTAIVLVIAIGIGIWFGTRGTAEPVNVYPFNYIGMTEYWGDSQESYGSVTTDKIQTVFLSDTQIVTEILVSAGDTVKKGDILMSFDTTLSGLQLERKRLDVEKLKLQLTQAQTQLWEIENMEPMVIPEYVYEEEEEPNLGTALSGSYQISTRSAYDGSTQEKALICWLSGDSSIDNALLEAIRQRAEKFQNSNAQQEPSSASALPEGITEATQASTVSTEETEIPETTEEALPAATEETVPETTEATLPVTTEETVPETTEATGPAATEETVPETTPETTIPAATEETVPETTEETQPAPEEFEVYDYYVIFKTTEGDMSLGARLLWQGLRVSGSAETGFRIRFFDAFGIEDHTLVPTEETEEEASGIPGMIIGSGYTASQIAELRSEQQKMVKEAEFKVKMAEAEYKIMQTELEDGNVYSQIDGEVISVLTEEEAKMGNQPLIKVSGGGGFYVDCSISELEKDNLQIGQEVTINDWNSGMTYTGEVKSVGDFPSSDSYWSGMGNPNTTYYPFAVFIDGSADLQAGGFVSVTYSTAGEQHGIYLQKPFVRTEQGQSYVYILGENGKLEKRFVTLGKSLWDSYQEVLSGLTEEDLIAFPYGKTVKEGAPAVESDLSTLYDY